MNLTNRISGRKNVIRRHASHAPPFLRFSASLDQTGQKPIRSDFLFDFGYSYTERSPTVRPIGLREPKYSPFGPGYFSPAVDPKVKSLEEKRRLMRERVQGKPLTAAERKVLVSKCQKNKTKRQINLA